MAADIESKQSKKPNYNAIDVSIYSEILGVSKAFTTLASLAKESDSPWAKASSFPRNHFTMNIIIGMLSDSHPIPNTNLPASITEKVPYRNPYKITP